jgi:hypothetical protein
MSGVGIVYTGIVCTDHYNIIIVSEAHLLAKYFIWQPRIYMGMQITGIPRIAAPLTISSLNKQNNMFQKQLAVGIIVL